MAEIAKNKCFTENIYAKCRGVDMRKGASFAPFFLIYKEMAQKSLLFFALYLIYAKKNDIIKLFSK